MGEVSSRSDDGRGIAGRVEWRQQNPGAPLRRDFPVPPGHGPGTQTEKAPRRVPFPNRKIVFYLVPSYTATAQATVAPTMGLLPMPMRPIISTWAGTEEEPANWASPCIRPMESVRP